MADSSRRRSAAKGKPDKPREDFPLFPHANGRWAKKVRGRLVYFGGWKDDPKGVEALDRWLDQKDDLLAGRTPRANHDGLTVADLVNAFLSHKQSLVESGELQQRTWNEYHGVCAVIVGQFGRKRLSDDLAAGDFEALRASFAKSAGPVRLGNLIQITRCVLKYGVDTGLLKTTVRYGPGFKRPSKSVLRRHRAAQGPKLFSADEIHQLLDTAGPSMQAMILLAINAALGNMDLARLEFGNLDLTGDDGWGLLEYPRGKTGIGRRCVLWPETRQVLEDAIVQRKAPKDETYIERVFITKYGDTWEKETTDNPLSNEFAKLAKAAGITRKGATFYALRHTLRTVADETRDFPAIDLVMGHARDDMGSVYRERIDDSRLREVAQYVREWLYGDKVKPKKPKKSGRKKKAKVDGKGSGTKVALKLFAG